MRNKKAKHYRKLIEYNKADTAYTKDKKGSIVLVDSCSRSIYQAVKRAFKTGY